MASIDKLSKNARVSYEGRQGTVAAVHVGVTVVGDDGRERFYLAEELDVIEDAGAQDQEARFDDHLDQLASELDRGLKEFGRMRTA